MLVKANNRIFGCYTKHGFNPSVQQPDNDQESFIFSLSDYKKFPIHKGKVATRYHPNIGPAFGKDLSITINQG